MTWTSGMSSSSSASTDAGETIRLSVDQHRWGKGPVPAERTLGQGTAVDYTLIDRLGVGGMGEVHSARQRSLDRVVAIKYLKPDKSDPANEQSFLIEAAVLAELEHPNIVPVIEAGRDENGSPFYAMKRVGGHPWRVFFSKSPAKEEVAKKASTTSGQPQIRFFNLQEHIDTLLKVSDAIAFAHHRGVLHRDLKPENIMVGEYGEVVVLDWGLALALPREDGTYVSRAQPLHEALPAGSPAYMAPEMAQGDFAQVGKECDVYLLGGILFEIITGKRPHEGGSIDQVLMRAAANTICDTDVEHELLSIAYKALATEPKDRFSSVRSFQKALRTWQHHRESLKLTTTALSLMEGPGAGGDVQMASLVVFTLDQALDIWPENKRAKQLKKVAVLTLIKALVQTGAYTEAEKLIDRNDPAHAEACQQLEEGREAQEHLNAAYDRLRELETQTDKTWVAVMEDDFTADDSKGRWLIDDPHHRLEQGALILKREPPNLIRCQHKLLGDFRLSFRAKLTEGRPCDLSCFFAARDLDDPVATLESGYQVKLGAYGNTLNLILRSGARISAQQGSPLSKNREFAVVVERIGYTIAVHLDDRLIAVVDDPEPLADADRNVFGLFTWDCVMTVSSVRVERPQRARLERLVDVAERQLGMGRFEVAKALYEDVLEGDDPNGIALAKRGLRRLERKVVLRDEISRIKERIRDEFPGASIAVEGDSLAVGLENQRSGDLSLLKGLPITSLNVSNNGMTSVESLRGLELTRLWLNHNSVEDLTPLHGQPLELLGLSHNGKQSCQDLGSFPLTKVDLAYNRLTNLHGMQGLPLASLSIQGNPVDDVQALAGLPLMNLVANETAVSDLAPLESCPLVDVRLIYTKVEDLSPLKGVSSLVFDRAPACDLTPIATPNLQLLSLDHTAVGDLSPLAQCPQLHTLLFSHSEIDNIAPLRGLPLMFLTFSYTRVDDLSPLQGTTTLRIVNMSGTPVHSLQALKSSRVESLYLRGSQVREIAPLAHGIRLLHCDDGQITDLHTLSPDCRVDSLRESLVNDDEYGVEALKADFPLGRFVVHPDGLVADLSGVTLRGLGRLNSYSVRDLDLSACGLDSLTMFRFFKTGFLKKLSLADNPLSSLDGIDDFALRELDLSRTQVTNFDCLQYMPLEVLILDGIKTESLASLEGLPLRRLSLKGAQFSALPELPTDCVVER